MNLGIIRAGQRHPYRKGTKAQIAERIGYCVQLVVAGLTKTQITRAVRHRYDIQFRQTSRYLDLVYHGRKPVPRWHAHALGVEPAPEPVNPQLDHAVEMSRLCYPDYFK